MAEREVSAAVSNLCTTLKMSAIEKVQHMSGRSPPSIMVSYLLNERTGNITSRRRLKMVPFSAAVHRFDDPLYKTVFGGTRFMGKVTSTKVFYLGMTDRAQLVFWRVFFLVLELSSHRLTYWC